MQHECELNSISLFSSKPQWAAEALLFVRAITPPFTLTSSQECAASLWPTALWRSVHFLAWKQREQPAARWSLCVPDFSSFAVIPVELRVERKWKAASCEKQSGSQVEATISRFRCRALWGEGRCSPLAVANHIHLININEVLHRLPGSIANYYHFTSARKRSVSILATKFIVTSDSSQSLTLLELKPFLNVNTFIKCIYFLEQGMEICSVSLQSSVRDAASPVHSQPPHLHSHTNTNTHISLERRLWDASAQCLQTSNTSSSNKGRRTSGHSVGLRFSSESCCRNEKYCVYGKHTKNTFRWGCNQKMKEFHVMQNPLLHKAAICTQTEF